MKIVKIAAVGLLVCASAFSQSMSNGGTLSNGATLGFSVAIPAPAAAAGFNTITFSSNFQSGDIDLSQSLMSGYRWYFTNFFSSPASGVNLTIGNPTVLGGNNLGVALSTAAQRGSGFVGTAFGGGFYFEVTMSFNPAQVVTANGSNTGGWAATGGGWPSVWGGQIESFLGQCADEWPGQIPCYTAYVETDTFEYEASTPADNYGGTLHAGYGKYATTCLPSYCLATSYNNYITPSPAPDFTQMHKVGALWIPATGSTNGTWTFYFDGTPYHQQTWEQFIGGVTQPPPLPVDGSYSTTTTCSPGICQPWTFGAMDLYHNFIILSTGSNQPVSVRSMFVWQESAVNNIVQ